MLKELMEYLSYDKYTFLSHLCDGEDFKHNTLLIYLGLVEYYRQYKFLV